MLIIQRSGRGATRREKVYEEKRKRKWLGAKWKEGGQREWLEYDEEEKVMFCAHMVQKSMNRRQSPFGVTREHQILN